MKPLARHDMFYSTVAVQRNIIHFLKMYKVSINAINRNDSHHEIHNAIKNVFSLIQKNYLKVFNI